MRAETVEEIGAADEAGERPFARKDGARDRSVMVLEVAAEVDRRAAGRIREIVRSRRGHQHDVAGGELSRRGVIDREPRGSREHDVEHHPDGVPKAQPPGAVADRLGSNRLPRAKGPQHVREYIHGGDDSRRSDEQT